MNNLVCIRDFETAALKAVEPSLAEYYRGGADEEITAEENKQSFNRWKLRPRVLRDVSIRKTMTMVLGKPVAFPVGIAPTAFHRIATEDGECATARAAQTMGCIFTLSLFATRSFEQIAEAAPDARKWCQFFILKSRARMLELIRRAEAAGFEALAITVDGQYFGKRRACLRKPFDFPPDLSLENVEPNKGNLTYSSVAALHKTMDPGPTWEDIKWIKSTTNLPVVVKGIMTPEDAKLGVEAGVDAIWVSNHGGRQLDTVEATIDVLPDIVRQVHGQCEVYVDGGIGRGSDIFKALALGANMVFVGRPIIWGLVMGGEAGVERVLEILKDELDLTMALTGAPTIADISRSHVMNNKTFTLKPRMSMNKLIH